MTRGNKRLLRLARYIEKRQTEIEAGKRDEPGYDQYIITHSCGAPACAMGYARALWPKSKLSALNDSLRTFFGMRDNRELDLIFGGTGCNNAGTNWRKAVAYIREFVEKRGGV